MAPPPRAIKTASTPDATLSGDGRGAFPGHLDVPADYLQLRTQRTDPVKLGRGRRAGGHDRHSQATTVAGPAQGLAEVAGAGAHGGRPALPDQRAGD